MVLGLAVGLRDSYAERTPPAVGLDGAHLTRDGFKTSRNAGFQACPPGFETSRSVGTRRAGHNVLVTVAILLLFGSVPVRVSREVSKIDLTRVAYGVHGWEAEQTGTRFRWTKRRASFFVNGQAEVIEIPLRARLQNPQHPLDVDIAV